jgi:hypothetical protein
LNNIKKKFKIIFIFYIILINLNINIINNFNTKIKYEGNNDFRKLNFLDIFNVNKKNSKKKNLIIGAVVKYQWNKIRNFFVSLMNAKFENCDYVMYVGKMDKETIKLLKSYGITIFKIPDKYLKSGSKIHNYRFKIYKDFLSKNTNKYNMIFTADVRDTIFQKDIFKFYNQYNSPFIGLFLEDGIIKNEIHNKKWVNHFCPKGNIWDKQIICSGTILGTIDKFIEFCNELWNFVVKKKDYKNPREQGIVNCLIYSKNLLKDYLIIQDNHGPVMTIGLSKRENIYLDKRDNIFNYDNQIAAVIHQYDRKLDITERLNKKFDIKISRPYFFDKIKNNKDVFKMIIIYIILIFTLFFLFFFSKKRRIFYNWKVNLKKIKSNYFQKYESI